MQTAQRSTRAVLILGMHRSGTSAFARGMQALGVYLGTNMLATRPDNPTGYWEDQRICDLNERLLAVFGLKWTDISLIETNWSEPAVESLRLEATEYLQADFASKRLWGFKDPRTIRLLPFWQSVMRLLEVDESYVVAIRNPLSVAASLFQRQGMDTVTAYKLWLAYMVPYLNRLADHRFVVADYDLLMAQPQAQLERIACALDIQFDEQIRVELRRFAENFLDPTLRHTLFNEFDFDPGPNLTPLAREAYLWLLQLATDQTTHDSSRFWLAWQRSRDAVEALLNVKRRCN
jgi:O-antigen biosynthesis protein